MRACGGCRHRFRDIKRLREERLRRYQDILETPVPDVTVSSMHVEVALSDDDALDVEEDTRLLQFTQSELGQESEEEPDSVREGSSDSQQQFLGQLFSMDVNDLPDDFVLGPEGLAALTAVVSCQVS
jgi:hypothetical protein